ncbi:S41 family peptidase [Microbacterium esteraromaticum]|uniref:S41 family peptidase n=1 Tax=Microbacterium esteraromaticum TaxID=57043 RepID=UPI0030B1E408
MEVAHYADAAVEYMEDGLYAEGPAWEAKRDEAIAKLYRAASIEDTYPLLESLVVEAGGLHSALLTPADVARNSASFDPEAEFPLPAVQSVGAGISALTLPAFNGTETAAVARYQEAALSAVKDARAQTSCGWIVDVRSNGGGNAYPMLSSVAPLLSDGRVLGFRNRNSNTTWISVSNGNLHADMAAVPPPTPNFSVDQPVAVLTDRATASAAETVVVAFSGQLRTAQFGTPTAGLTTSNETHLLSDGAALVVSTAYYVNRHGKIFNARIAPTSNLAAWDTVETAVAWLESQCAGSLR